jgi:VanZ family protein
MVYWGPVAVYAAAIFIQSGNPGPDLPSIPLIDKLAHAGIYAVLCLLVFRALRRHRLGRHPVWCAAFSILFTVLYGISDEWHQTMVPERQAEAYDVLADLIGAVAGALVSLRIWPESAVVPPRRSH